MVFKDERPKENGGSGTPRKSLVENKLFIPLVVVIVVVALVAIFV